ncbi:MAG: hypothetical protein LC109_12270 [Bacteroidia bacterium]|jgi:hypothetical protein|nr:hypothetical protein [Bacteroidia bacterium]
MKQFFIILTLLFFAFSGIVKLVETYIHIDKTTYDWIFLSNLYYFFLTLLLFIISQIGLKSKNHKIFIKTLGVSIILRLLFTLTFISIALIINNLDRIQFITANILLYFIYMAFEIKFLAFNLRHDSAQGQNVENINK